MDGCILEEDTLVDYIESHQDAIIIVKEKNASFNINPNLDLNKTSTITDISNTESTLSDFQNVFFNCLSDEPILDNTIVNLACTNAFPNVKF